MKDLLCRSCCTVSIFHASNMTFPPVLNLFVSFKRDHSRNIINKSACITFDCAHHANTQPAFCFQHIVKCHGNTLLPQFLGMYRVSVDSEEAYLIVMRNMFSHRLVVHRKYDLKVRRNCINWWMLAIHQVKEVKKKNKKNNLFYCCLIS